VKVFYSWQSNIKGLRNKIGSAVEKAVHEIGRDLELEVSVDRDTKNTAGAVEIADKILEKIGQARVFDADVTLVNNSELARVLRREVTPNPNVLLELGYAVRKIGWDNVVLVVDETRGRIEDLPFDLRHRRVLPFSKDKRKFLKSMREAIEASLTDRDSTGRIDRDLADSHDIEVFNRLMEDVPEEELKSLLDGIGLYRIYEGSEVEFLFTKLQEAELPKNQFLNTTLNPLMIEFATACRDFAMFIATNFFRTEDIENRTYELQKYRNLDPASAEEEIKKLREELFIKADIVVDKFDQFRKNIKQKLMV